MLSPEAFRSCDRILRRRNRYRQVLVRNLTNCARMFSDRALASAARSNLHSFGIANANPDVTARRLPDTLAETGPPMRSVELWLTKDHQNRLGNYLDPRVLSAVTRRIATAQVLLFHIEGTRTE